MVFIRQFQESHGLQVGNHGLMQMTATVMRNKDLEGA